MAYGTVTGLRRECTGIDLSRLAQGGELESILDDELDTASVFVEMLTNRLSGGFNHNEDATIVIDGSGHRVLRLAPYGYVPLLGISAVVIDDDEQPLTDFVYYAHGDIEYVRPGTTTDITGIVGAFSPGTQNIELTIDWGYIAVPDLVQRATYLLAKAAVLDRISEAQDPTDAAIPPGLIRYQQGEMSVQFDPAGQYGANVRRAMQRAKSYLQSYMRVVVDGTRGRRAFRGWDAAEAELAHYREGA